VKRNSVIIPPIDRRDLEDTSLSSLKKWVKDSALDYLLGLLNAVNYASKNDEWEEYSEAARFNLIEIFFHDGRNHFTHGLIPISELPQSRHYQN
jgi:ribosome biogenesis GTPase A